MTLGVRQLKSDSMPLELALVSKAIVFRCLRRPVTKRGQIRVMPEEELVRREAVVAHGELVR